MSALKPNPDLRLPVLQQYERAFHNTLAYVPVEVTTIQIHINTVIQQKHAVLSTLVMDALRIRCATKACIDNRKKIVKQQYLLHMFPQYGALQCICGWDRFGSLGHSSRVINIAILYWYWQYCQYFFSVLPEYCNTFFRNRHWYWYWKYSVSYTHLTLPTILRV